MVHFWYDIFTKMYWSHKRKEWISTLSYNECTFSSEERALDERSYLYQGDDDIVLRRTSSIAFAA